MTNYIGIQRIKQSDREAQFEKRKNRSASGYLKGFRTYFYEIKSSCVKKNLELNFRNSLQLSISR